MGKKRIQTNLGKRLEFDNNLIDKTLIEAGLKDHATKLPTQKAIDEGYARVKPRQSKTPCYTWDSHKVSSLLLEHNEEVIEKQFGTVDSWVKKVLKYYDKVEKECGNNQDGNDKPGILMCQMAFDNIPEILVNEVRARVEEKLGYEVW